MLREIGSQEVYQSLRETTCSFGIGDTELRKFSLEYESDSKLWMHYARYATQVLNATKHEGRGILLMHPLFDPDLLIVQRIKPQEGPPDLGRYLGPVHEGIEFQTAGKLEKVDKGFIFHPEVLSSPDNNWAFTYPESVWEPYTLQLNERVPYTDHVITYRGDEIRQLVMRRAVANIHYAGSGDNLYIRRIDFHLIRKLADWLEEGVLKDIVRFSPDTGTFQYLEGGIFNPDPATSSKVGEVLTTGDLAIKVASESRKDDLIITLEASVLGKTVNRVIQVPTKIIKPDLLTLPEEFVRRDLPYCVHYPPTARLINVWFDSLSSLKFSIY